MNLLTRLLLLLADAALAAGHAIKVAAIWLWGVIDAVLNPILSPLLEFLNPLCTRLGDVVYALLDPFPAWIGLTLISIVAGVVMLIAFRYTSNQTAIGRAKDDIKANLLALKLYKDDLRVTFSSQISILWAIVRLQRFVLTPVLWMTLPMLLVLAQMGLRYQWRPLRQGEQTLVRVFAAEPQSIVSKIRMTPNPGLVVEIGPIAGRHDLVWRVRGGEPGRHQLEFTVAGVKVGKELVVGESYQRVSAQRPGRHWTDQLFHPAESVVPSEAGLSAIEIGYGGVDSWVCGSDWWVVYFFVISMAAALVFKPFFRVRF